MTFSEGLHEYLAAHPVVRQTHPLLWRALEDPDTPRKRRRIAYMENHVRKEMGVESNSAIDWSKVDWLRIVQWVAAILTIALLIL